MKLLLDTHTWLWWSGDASRLSGAALAACTDFENELILSVVSVWEIQIKTQLGKLKLTVPLRDMIAEQRTKNALDLLAVSYDHVLTLDSLPLHHRDPFDRLLIAQAVCERATLLSLDPKMALYAADVGMGLIT